VDRRHPMSTSRSNDAFTIERHGELVVVTATPLLESLDEGVEEQAAELIMGPIRDQEGALLVFDLSPVDYFGSIFLAVLIRCWKLVLARGGTMALAGVSDRAKELLRLTSLDIVWPIYATRREAMEALLAD
jgi:anti-anti-sigma factor